MLTATQQYSAGHPADFLRITAPSVDWMDQDVARATIESISEKDPSQGMQVAAAYREALARDEV